MEPLTVLITGSTDGIGQQLALRLAADGHCVLVHGRNPDKLARTLELVRQASTGGEVEGYLADLSTLDGVYTLAREVQQKHDKLDVLINNAGVFAGKKERQANEHNVELTFMLSVLAPYLLTRELEGLLEESGQGRIINTSSFMHHFARGAQKLDFGFVTSFSPWRAYNNSKLYAIWLTRALAREYADRGACLTVNAYHPGLVKTNIGGSADRKNPMTRLFGCLMDRAAISPQEGAETGYYLAHSSQVEGISGAYFDRKKKARISAHGYSQAAADRLLEYCDTVLHSYRATSGQ